MLHERRKESAGQQQQGAAPAESSYRQLHGQHMKPADWLGKMQQQQASDSDKL